MGKKTLKQKKKESEFNKIILILLMALGAQTMIMELAMPRILAPTFGNTLFCWTAIITVVLAALSLGYYWGGRIALKKNASKMVFILSALSAFWVLLLGVWGQRLTPGFSSFGIEVGPLVVSTVMAFVPAVLSAAVLPMVVELRRIRAGLAAGECYAWSTVGSVAGVLCTGYLFLPMFGIKGTMMTASVIVFIALAIQGKALLATVGAILAVMVYSIPVPGFAGAIFDKSNGYHRIIILESNDGENIRYLYRDNSLDGAVNMDSNYPELSYQQMIDDIVEQIPTPEKVFVIGGGAFSMPVYLKDKYPGMRIDAAEIDPDMVEVAKTYLGLEPDFNILIGDGRQLLRKQSGKYDLIINDAFKGFNEIPYHLVTREFHKMVSEKLSPEGIYAINVIGLPSDSRLTRSLISTLSKEFKHVTIQKSESGCLHNAWIMAGQKPIDYGRKPFENEIDSFLLTDNHSPVEYLLARDFISQR